MVEILIRPMHKRLNTLFVLALTTSMASIAAAQELEPRAYRTLPTGLNFAVLAFGYSSGNVVVDPTVPIKDMEAEVCTASASYLRTFGLFGRSAGVSLTAPYLYMSVSGYLHDEYRSGSRTGWADARARLSINLLGGPALGVKDFASYRQRTNLGVSLTVAAPTGQYDSSYVINFGANRWGFKPEIGVSSGRGRWTVEAAAGVWFFTTNHEAFGGATMSQDPIGSLQAHLSYDFENRMWLALNLNYFTGGRTNVDGLESVERQKNSRVGLTWSVPLRGGRSVKLAVQTGAFTRVGADFDVATVAYQVRW